MTIFKKICLLLFITITPLMIISCSDDGPVQSKETENQVEIDSELLGTWKGLGILPRTLTFDQTNETEGFGVRITEDLNGYCKNSGANYLNRIDFRWTQIKKVDEGWSSFFYDQTTNLDCGGADELPRLAFERFYKIEGDTLYLGTEKDDTYVRVE